MRIYTFLALLLCTSLIVGQTVTNTQSQFNIGSSTTLQSTRFNALVEYTENGFLLNSDTLTDQPHRQILFVDPDLSITQQGGNDKLSSYPISYKPSRSFLAPADFHSASSMDYSALMDRIICISDMDGTTGILFNNSNPEYHIINPNSGNLLERVTYDEKGTFFSVNATENARFQCVGVIDRNPFLVLPWVGDASNNVEIFKDITATFEDGGGIYTDVDMDYYASRICAIGALHVDNFNVTDPTGGLNPRGYALSNDIIVDFFDLVGTPANSFIYSSSGSNRFFASSVKSIGNGNFLVALGTSDLDNISGALILLIDVNGDIKWQKHVTAFKDAGGQVNDLSRVREVTINRRGEPVILFSDQQGTNTGTGVLAQFDQSGNVLWVVEADDISGTRGDVTGTKDGQIAYLNAIGDITLFDMQGVSGCETRAELVMSDADFLTREERSFAFKNVSDPLDDSPNILIGSATTVPSSCCRVEYEPWPYRVVWADASEVAPNNVEIDASLPGSGNDYQWFENGTFLKGGVSEETHEVTFSSPSNEQESFEFEVNVTTSGGCKNYDRIRLNLSANGQWLPANGIPDDHYFTTLGMSNVYLPTQNSIVHTVLDEHYEEDNTGTDINDNDLLQITDATLLTSTSGGAPHQIFKQIEEHFFSPPHNVVYNYEYELDNSPTGSTCGSAFGITHWRDEYGNYNWGIAPGYNEVIVKYRFVIENVNETPNPRKYVIGGWEVDPSGSGNISGLVPQFSDYWLEAGWVHAGTGNVMSLEVWINSGPSFPVQICGHYEDNTTSHTTMGAREPAIVKSRNDEPNASGIHLLKSQYLKMYPNPAKEFINVNGSEIEKARSYSVISSFGKDVTSSTDLMSRKKGVVVLGVQNLAPGVYVLRCILENGAITSERFIKE